MAEPYKQPKYGGFQQPRFIGAGNVNTDLKAPANGEEGESKELSAQLSQPGMKLGAKLTESTMLRTFEKGFKPLYAGEPYRASLADRKEARDAATAARASERPFKPPSGPHRTLAKGDYTGHLGRRFEHIGGDLAHKTLKGEVQSAPPNIKTNPSKKGSYGQPWTTLSERKGAKGVAGEYAYHTDPYDSARAARMEEMKAHPIEKAFKPANYPRKGGGTVTPGVLFGKANAWVPGGAAPAAEAGAAAEAKEPVSSKPFVPSAIPKTGYNRTLEKFPPYVPDPLDVKLAAEREKKRKDKEAQPPKAFVPSNTPKTQATKSIVRMNLGR